MPLWDPSSETWIQYQTRKSYHDDRTNHNKSNAAQIEAKISEQTKQLVANNDELKRTFEVGYDTINSTLEWGVERLSSQLSEIDISIDTLRADFNYNMGILIQEAQINNRLLSSLLDKLDSIQKTLDSPVLTQARELYRLGCQLASKGLFDKALESLHKSEEKYDADFFTQYRIGYLYLFGANDDCNVIDLEKSKQHLVTASRYAKAEIKSDAAFAKLAAESLLLASISVYGQLGDKSIDGTTDSRVRLLSEAKEHAEESTELYAGLSEAWFHSAKYSALLHQPEECKRSLGEAIALDRKYAIKVEVDKSFEALRPSIVTFLGCIRDDQGRKARTAIDQANRSLMHLSEWMMGPDSKHLSSYEQVQKMLGVASRHLQTSTYFGFLDAISVAEEADESIGVVKDSRYSELVGDLNRILSDSITDVSSWTYKHEIEEIKKLRTSLNLQLNGIKEKITKGITSLDHYLLLMSEIEQKLSCHNNERDKANEKHLIELEEEKKKKAIEDEKNLRIHTEEKEREYQINLGKRKVEAMYKYAGRGFGFGISFGLLGSVASCFACLGKYGLEGSGPGDELFSYWGWGLLIGITVIGTIFGGAWGYTYGVEEKKFVRKRWGDVIWGGVVGGIIGFVFAFTIGTNSSMSFAGFLYIVFGGVIVGLLFGYSGNRSEIKKKN